MDPLLERESKKLLRSWMQHDAAMLRDYLVSSVEDPRINLQSVLSRHFLVRQLTGERFSLLMEQECRFAAVINWLGSVTGDFTTSRELEGIMYALKRGADN